MQTLNMVEAFNTLKDEREEL